MWVARYVTKQRTPPSDNGGLICRLELERGGGRDAITRSRPPGAGRCGAVCDGVGGSLVAALDVDSHGREKGGNEMLRFLTGLWRRWRFARVEVAAAAGTVVASREEELVVVPAEEEKVVPRAPPDPERIARRRALRTKAAARRAIADEVDALLTRMSSLTLDSFDSGSEKRAYIDDLASELLGCDFYFIAPEHDEAALGLEHDLMFVAPHEENAADLLEMFWPIDTAFTIRKSDKGCYSLQRVRTVAASEVRGRVRMVVPKMLRVVQGELYDDDSWWLESLYVGWVGGRWQPLPQNERVIRTTTGGTLVASQPTDSGMREEVAANITMGFSAELTRRYEWFVALGDESRGPRLLLPTSPVGCRELFRDRERGAGRSRRAALRHWVVRHYRDRGEAGLSFVRQHLRGATSFLWRALAGEVLVSAYDLERDEFFRQEAEKWRARRQHNTFRVRLKRKRTA